MNAPAAAAVVIPALVFGAAALRFRSRARCLQNAVTSLQRRQNDVLEAARVITAASRESSAAVLCALHAALVSLEPAIDDVLVYRREGEELACVYTGGERSAHYTGTRLRINGEETLAARAAAERRSVDLDSTTRAIIPTDRRAIAVPMEDARDLQAVVYASTRTFEAPIDREAVTRCISHAAAPYGLALDRETDRSNATYDALTGLYSPRAFRDTLKEHVSVARVSATSTFSLWFIDTDRFKQVNDTLGHRAGDRVLQEMAALLRQHTIAGVDIAARNGGDEFCAIVHALEKTTAIERAQTFCDAVSRHDFRTGFGIGASIGVASFPYDAATAEALLETADAAMYHSKRSGRNCVSFAVDGAFAVYS